MGERGGRRKMGTKREGKGDENGYRERKGRKREEARKIKERERGGKRNRW